MKPSLQIFSYRCTCPIKSIRLGQIFLYCNFHIKKKEKKSVEQRKKTDRKEQLTYKYTNGHIKYLFRNRFKRNHNQF